MWKRKLVIIPSLVGNYLNRINKFLFNITKINIILNHKFMTSDDYSLLHKYPTQLHLPKKN